MIHGLRKRGKAEPFAWFCARSRNNAIQTRPARTFRQSLSINKKDKGAV
jgi:hypothetical protein